MNIIHLWNRLCWRAREREAIRLAAISTAADQNTRKSIKERIGPENPHFTAAYADVCRAVDREMEHREEREKLERLLNFKHAVKADAPTEQQILAALSIVDDATPLWRAVHCLINQHEQVELESLLQPALTDAARHFNAGRAAMLEDLRASLLAKWNSSRKVPESHGS